MLNWNLFKNRGVDYVKIDNYHIAKSEFIQKQKEEQKMIENLNQNTKKVNNEKKLKEAIADFSAVFLKLMFKSMRSTLPENKYIDGGYAEEIFTDMMDDQVSELGSQQNTFKNINQIMFEQLNKVK